MTLDLGYITHYIIHYDTGVPSAVIIGVSLLVLCIVVALFLLSTNYSVFVRQASFSLFAGYVFLVLCATIFYREETYVFRYTLRPLWSYTVLYNRLLAQIILNIFMFIPVGLFLGGALKKKYMLSAIGISFVLSLFIETVQLISTRGIFSVDDIIHNVLGCAIGYGAFRLCYSLLTVCTK